MEESSQKENKMAARYSEGVERLEDIYQEEIIKEYASIGDFKAFARSKHGLCLDEVDIQHIVENNPNLVEEQKMLMLKKWEEKTGPRATAHEIRSVVLNFRNQGKDYVHLSGGYGYYKSKRISKHSHVYLGEQRCQFTPPHEIVIKLIEFKEENKREATNLLKLGQHPNVAGMFYSGLYETILGTFIYIVIEACRLENLGDYMNQMRELEISLCESVKMAVAKQVLQGVEFIHFNKIVHGDLKPDNILISMNGKFIKVADYGLSKTLRPGFSTASLSSKRIGSDGYRAPELYLDQGISQKSDVFSCALVEYAIVSDGEHPYGSDPDKRNINLKKNKNCNLQRIRVTEIKQMESLFRQMLQTNPKNRPTIAKVLESTLFKQVDTTIQLVNFQDLSTISGNALIQFDYVTKRILCFSLSRALWRIMWKVCKELEGGFSFIVIEHSIYALRKKEMHQLKYFDPDAKWNQLTGTNENHGRWPAVIELKGSIYVCGTGDWSITSLSVEMYNKVSDIWTIIRGITISRRWPRVVAAKGCIYCIGGLDEKDQEVQIVQRLEPETGTATEMNSIPRLPMRPSVVEKDEVLYVSDQFGMECYDIQKNSWKTLETDHWPQADNMHVHTHVIDNKLYIVFHLWPGVEIYELNHTTGKMTLLDKRANVEMYSNSIAVKL